MLQLVTAAVLQLAQWHCPARIALRRKHVVAVALERLLELAGHGAPHPHRAVAARRHDLLAVRPELRRRHEAAVALERASAPARR